MATKTFPHAVIYNGEFYAANTPIKVKEVKTEGNVSTEPTPKKAVNKYDKGTSRKP